MQLLRKLKVLLGLCLLSILCAGCLSPRIPISNLFQQKKDVALDWESKEKSSSPSGYNIGIVSPSFNVKMSQGFSADTSLLKKALEINLEKVLIAKGCTVSGPFLSYDEMSYPERARASYIIYPIFESDVSISISNNRLGLPEYGGPNGERWTLAKSEGTYKISGEFVYKICEPLTNEKLEIYRIKIDPITKTFPVYWAEYTAGEKSWWQQENYPEDHSLYNSGIEVTEVLFNKFMKKAEEMFSIEGFKALDKYKEEIRTRKRY